MSTRKFKVNPHLLDGKVCYLSGPIENDLGSGPKGWIESGWRGELKNLLSFYDIVISDPSFDKDGWVWNHQQNRGYPVKSAKMVSFKKLRKVGKFDELAKHRYLRALDLRMVDKADFLIVRFLPTVLTCGTWEEIFWANREKKPILIWTDNKKEIPIWLFWTLNHHHFFETQESLLSYLDKVDRGDIDEESRRRWII